MPNYISSAAAKDLLLIIQDSYFGGLCSWSETASRLEALSALAGPGQETQFAQRVLVMSGFSIDDHWNEESAESESSGSSHDSDGPRFTQIWRSHPDWLDEDEPPILQLLPAVSTGLSDWHFHQADADYFPSIPHGHWQGRDQPKLDPYTGWNYQGSKQTARESRKKIVALWNDDKFRRFARAAIDYYLQAFPSYGGWRVRDPRRLPRRR